MQVMEAFAQATNNAFDLNIVRVDAEDEFLSPWQGRRIRSASARSSADTFIEVFEQRGVKASTACALPRPGHDLSRT
jgi:GMP synthase PP-ATPase subunit